MPKSRHVQSEGKPVNWEVFKKLWPYLTEFKKRVMLAILCLVAAKLASVLLIEPFLTLPAKNKIFTIFVPY